MGALFLLILLASMKGSGGASPSPARKVKGRSGRTYYVTVIAPGPGRPFVTSTVLYGIEGRDVTLIQYRQYTQSTPGSKHSGVHFLPGDRELTFRAPMAAVNPKNDPVADAVKDFGPYVADNGLT